MIEHRSVPHDSSPLPSFEHLFKAAAQIRARAHGRVNLMGDHTDYNGGFVLPAGIPQATSVELTPSAGRRVRVWSTAFPADAPAEYTLGDETRGGTWVDYVKGMTVALSGYGLANGFCARIASDVPAGAGLSSSAALEISLGRALRDAFALPLGDVELAQAGRRAENEFVGAPVGIMDQMACSLASPSTAIFLDTRSLAFERIPIPPSAALIVVDSRIAHRHAGGEYARRRHECAEAAAVLGVKELRDLDAAPADLTALSPVLARRARHVVTENQRVIDTVSALRSGALERAGALFTESHASLRDDFDVSVPDIDALVEIAGRVTGVFGARLTGGGFGGAIVALAAAGHARAAAGEIVSQYTRLTGRRGVVVREA